LCSPDTPASAKRSLSSAPADAEDDLPSDELELLVVTIGPQSFGIPADAARAVAGATRLVPVTGAQPTIAGMLLLEDRSIAAIDGHALLGLPRFQAPEQAKPVAIGRPDSPTALLVDAVDPYRLRCLRREIGCLPPALATLWRGIAVGLVRGGSELIVIVDPERITRAANYPIAPTLSAEAASDAA
jgi:chemotaxis signal transduction protein